MRTWDKLWPEPESFCACIDGRSYFEAVVLIEEYSVEDIAFSCSIFAYNSDDGNMFILISF